jgi:hypothetical protein
MYCLFKYLSNNQNSIVLPLFILKILFSYVWIELNSILLLPTHNMCNPIQSVINFFWLTYLLTEEQFWGITNAWKNIVSVIKGIESDILFNVRKLEKGNIYKYEHKELANICSIMTRFYCGNNMNEKIKINKTIIK